MTKKLKPKTPSKPVKEVTLDNKLDSRGHKPNSRKSRVHELFDTQGPEAAFVLGQKLKLKDNTLRSWFMTWRRTKPAKAAKVAAKSKSREETKPEAAPVAAVH